MYHAAGLGRQPPFMHTPRLAENYAAVQYYPDQSA
jgi:hypothetical protein